MILVKPSHEILTQINGKEILKKIEAAGRTCYKSETLITEDSAIEFVGKILARGHHSVIEHENISVRIICDRGVTHEIVRHRLAAYSQESTRYCNYKGGVAFVIPPWVALDPGEYWETGYPPNIKVMDLGASRCWFEAMAAASIYYTRLVTDQGWSPQQARSVLPNSLKTEIVMTANLREWRHVFHLRCAKAAHPQMREVMLPLLEEFRARLPYLFDKDEYLPF